MQYNSDPFTDIFKLNQHALHHWLVRIGILFIFAGAGALLFNVQNGLDRWLVITGFTLSALAMVRWFALQRPHWHWVAITFFSLSAVVGVFIYLVLIGVFFPLPTPEPAAVIAQVPSQPTVENRPTETATATSTESPSPTIDPLLTPIATKKTTKSLAQPTETLEPTHVPTVEQIEEPTVTQLPTLLVVVPPTITPTAEVVKTRYLHFVQPDENLTCISINYLGSDRYVPQICQFSQEFGLMGDDCGEYLAPGRRIVIPTSLVPGYESIPDASLPPHNPNACLTPDEKSE